MRPQFQVHVSDKYIIVNKDCGLSVCYMFTFLKNGNVNKFCIIQCTQTQQRIHLHYYWDPFKFCAFESSLIFTTACSAYHSIIKSPVIKFMVPIRPSCYHTDVRDYR